MNGDSLEQELQAGAVSVVRPGRAAPHEHVRQHVREVAVQQPLRGVLPSRVPDLTSRKYGRQAWGRGDGEGSLICCLFSLLLLLLLLLWVVPLGRCPFARKEKRKVAGAA